MSLVLRATKGSRLSTAEMDANLSGLADLSLTTFAQSGSSAFAQDMQSRERKTFLLTDYKNTSGTQVLGDNSRDNTSGLVAALLAMKTASDSGAEVELQIPAGTYLLSIGASMPFLQAARVKVRGSGIGTTILKIPASTNPAAACFWSIDTDAEISDLTLSYASNAAHGIRSVVTVSNVAVRRVKCIGTGSNAKGIWIRSGTNVWVEDCIVDNQSGTPDIGIYLDSCVNGFATRNIVTYTQQSGGASCIRADACNFTHLDHNHVAGGNIAHLGGGSYGTMTGNSIKTSSGDSGFGATWPDIYKYGTMTGNTCSGSTE